MSIQVQHVSKRFGRFAAVDDVSLDVTSGELVGLLGPSGSGKTTLLRILAGLTTPADGEIRWRQARVGPFDARLRDAVAFNGHLPALKDELSAEQNLSDWIALDDRSVARESIAAALDAVALERQRGLPVRVLSQGQRRRIGLARLRLVARPLWILDEPLTALDADGAGVLGELLAAHLDGGGLCVAASHQPLPMPAARVRSIGLVPATPR